MKISAYHHKVQYYETDCMQIVHHSNYIRFFEEARVDFLEKLGVSYTEIERSGYMVPVLSASAEYKGMTTFGDTLAICVKFEEFSGIRFSFSYKIYDVATGQLRTTGKTTHCYLKDGKPVNLKRALPETYQTMMGLVGLESEL